MDRDELGLSPLPWIVVYTVHDDVIQVVPHPARSATMAVISDWTVAVRG